MPKLPLRSREILKRLERLGFVRDHVTGSHTILYHPLTLRRAVVPEHRGDLPKGTVKAIMCEAGIVAEDFFEV